jgi:SAM-dependent methyltransferase
MIEDKIISAYEEMAEAYDRLIDHKPHNAYYDRPNTLALLPDVKDRSILDAGCGPGKYAEILIARGAQVTGFDISPKMVELAKQRNKQAGHFFVHNLAHPLNTLDNGSFDIALCALALHYVQNWDPTIKEFFRVLKPEGQLLISIEHPFFEYNYYKSNRYFDIEPVKCTWQGFGKPIEMNSYRRPLHACIEPITNNGFYIDKLIEPKPTREFEKADPEDYQALNTFPAFMCISAIRKKADLM